MRANNLKMMAGTMIGMMMKMTSTVLDRMKTNGILMKNSTNMRIGAEIAPMNEKKLTITSTGTHWID
jgi:hypothetical protein